MLSAGEYGFCERTSDTVSRVTPLAQLLWFQVFLFFCPPSPPHSDCFLQVLLCLRDCDISFSVAWISSFSFCFVVRLFPLDRHWLLWLQLLFLRWTFDSPLCHYASLDQLFPLWGLRFFIWNIRAVRSRCMFFSPAQISSEMENVKIIFKQKSVWKYEI